MDPTNQRSPSQMGGTPMNISTPSISGASPTPSQSTGSQNGTQPRQLPQLTHERMRQFLTQFNHEKNAAAQAGVDTPEGKAHFQNAQKIRAIILEYSKRNKINNARRAQMAQQRGQQAGQPQVMQQGMQMGQSPQQMQSPQMQSPQAQQNQPQAQPQVQHQAQPQPQAQGQTQGQPRRVDIRMLTPAQKVQLQKEEIVKYKRILKAGEQIGAQIRSLELRKNQPNVSDALLTQLSNQERDLRAQMDKCRAYATQIAGRLRALQRSQSPSVAHSPQPGQSGQSAVDQGMQQQQQQQQHQQLMAQRRNQIQQQQAQQQQSQRQQVAQAQSLLAQQQQRQQQQQAQQQLQQQQLQQQQQQQLQAQQAQAQAQLQQQQQQTQMMQLQQAPQGSSPQLSFGTPGSVSSTTSTQAKRGKNPRKPAARKPAKPHDTKRKSRKGSVSTPASTVTPTTVASTALAPQDNPNGTTITNVNAAASKPVSLAASPVSATGSGYSSKPRFQNISIPEELKVDTPTPAAVRMNNRPSLMGGNAMDAPALTGPTLVSPQHFDVEGERVLNKRKLRGLVKYVASEGGDTEVALDGDVEDMLLDLADEFVTSVTSFACRLAKHRRSESLDVRDVQINLERNWNIQIPGYAADEVRSTRKFMPNNAHNSKANGLSINKSVNRGR